MTISEFNARLRDDDCFPPVVQVGPSGELRHAQQFGTLRDGGDRYVVHHVDEHHVYHCRREGGPYTKWFQFQGMDDVLWAELQEEALIEY